MLLHTLTFVRPKYLATCDPFGRCVMNYNTYIYHCNINKYWIPDKQNIYFSSMNRRICTRLFLSLSLSLSLSPSLSLSEDGHSLSLPPVAKTNGSLTIATHPSRYTSMSDRFALSLSIQSHIGVFFSIT